MNKTLALSTIVLFALVMGMSTVLPVMAHNVSEGKGPDGSENCPRGFTSTSWTTGHHPDHNANGVVCVTPNGKNIDDPPCKNDKSPFC